MSNHNDSSVGSRDASGGSAGQSGGLGRSTMSNGAAKVFREFKWGLLTLFLLMVVVIGLVYDGGKKKKLAEATPPGAVQSTPPALPTGLETLPDPGIPPVDAQGQPPGNANPLANPAPAIPGSPVDHRITDIAGGSPLVLPDNHGGANVIPPASEVVKPPMGPAVSVTENTPKKAPATPAGKTYVVKSGDTLTSIAGRMLPGKNGVKAIMAANKSVLSDPNRLHPGMTLNIPAAAPALAETHAKAPETPEKKSDHAANAAPPGGDYVVQAGDTLERIARKLFKDGRKWHEIYEWNRDQLADPSRLRVGQALKVKQPVMPAMVQGPPAPAGSARAEGEAPAAQPVETVAPAPVTEPTPVLASTKYKLHHEETVLNSSSAQFP